MDPKRSARQRCWSVGLGRSNRDIGGEQPLPPYGSCLLGSVNLTKFVIDPFTENARFDWEGYKSVVRTFTRTLDNVVEINGLPLERQREEIISKRRHGMGYLGLGSTMVMLGMAAAQAGSTHEDGRRALRPDDAGWI